MKKFAIIPIFIALLIGSQVQSAPKDRDQMVIADRDELVSNDHWIYNDLPKAKQTAQSFREAADGCFPMYTMTCL